MNKNRIALFFLSLLMFCSSSYSLEVIEILGGRANQIAIAVSPFKEFSSQSDVGKVHKVIASDLDRSGLFDTLDTDGVSNPPSNDLNINFTKWSALDAKLIVVGKIDQTIDRMRVSWSLVDIYKEKTVLSMEYAGKPSQFRAIGHKIADQVYERLTGSKGVFHTKIAFVKKVSNDKYALNISDYDGFNIRTIMHSKQPIISPRWSPDGKQIAYVSFEKKKPVIYLQELATGQRTLLANFKGNNSAPAWSPDSKKLAIVLTYNANSQIYIIDADGENIKQVMRTRAINTEPAWAPNGKEIYFTSNKSGGPQIYKLNLEDDEVTRITYEGKYNLYPSLSYDGKLLLFLMQDDGKFKVAVQNLLSNQVLKLTNGPYDEAPIFSPNGHMILFSYKNYGKTSKIGTVSINGLKITPLVVGNEQIQEPTWGPITD